MLKSIPVRWGIVVLWMAAIFYGSSRSSIPTAPDEALDFVMKKSAHVGEYAILAILLLRAIYPNERLNARRLLLPLALAVLYAASDEFHQVWTSERHPSLRDVGIDSVGALVSLIVYASCSGRWDFPWSSRRPRDSRRGHEQAQTRAPG
ncbi:MAG: hypothetical protein EPO21_04035 [Chloroflexota bacterium]|nr:MAG: hypothetical protein EPO21_04035 [Chloroflexota bacterium]